MVRTAPPRQCHGATLVELCAALAVALTLAGMALPALKTFRERQVWRSTSEALALDLRLARAEAVRLNEAVNFRVSNRGQGGCYLLHTGPREGCDCADGKAVCNAAGAFVLHAQWLPAGSAIQLRSNVETLVFLAQQGVVTPTGTIEVSLRQGDTLRHRVAITGRVRTCAVGTSLGALRRCT